MRLLLDTHIAVWAVAKTARLSPEARDFIADPLNSIFVSVVSIWEITIKHALIRGVPNDMILSGHLALDNFRAAGFEILSVTAEHAVAVAKLPPLHKDPFDRMLLAQANVETLQLLTRDAAVARYGGLVMLV